MSCGVVCVVIVQSRGCRRAATSWRAWCGRCFLRRVLLWLLFLLAKLGGCLVDAIYEQGYRGVIFDCGNVCVDKHVNVNDCKIIRVQPEDLVHDEFDHRAAAVMFNGIFCSVPAK